jgi:hypothetical protein
MDVRLKKFALNYKMYDDVEDYINAAGHVIHRPLTNEEVDYLMKESSEVPVKAAEVLKAVGEFNVCHKCASIMQRSNDIFSIVKARSTNDLCDCCGEYSHLRTVAVDNFGKVARMSVKVAAIYPVKNLVRIINAPTRYKPLIGEVAEIISRQMTNRGPLYNLSLANGEIIPIPFKHNDLEAIQEAGSSPVDTSV